MNRGNAFWREVIDQIPHLVLIFRVDENEDAHLMFANKRVKQRLGYTAKEYVLASEADKHVQHELSTLIDKVAIRSHDVESIDTDVVELTTKFDERRNFVYEFELFKSRSGEKPYILVELSEVRTKAEASDNSDDVKNYNREQRHSASAVWSSWISTPLLDRIVKRFQEQLHKNKPIIVQGEHGTGKSALIDYVLKEHPAENTRRVAGQQLQQFWMKTTDLSTIKVLIVDGLDRSETEDQRKLLDWIEKHPNSQLIVTITRSIDELMNAGKILPEFYYTIHSMPLVLPPVRHRMDDILTFAQKYVTQAAEVLGISFGASVLSKEAVEMIKARTWEANLTQLIEVLRYSLLKHEEGNSLDLYIEEERQSSLFPEENIHEDEVLGFDEMNKRYLERILEITGGKIYGDDGAAALLNLKPTTLQSKLKRLGIK
jgi:DNA-binding NtrC family response regulator